MGAARGVVGRWSLSAAVFGSRSATCPAFWFQSMARRTAVPAGDASSYQAATADHLRLYVRLPLLRGEAVSGGSVQAVAEVALAPAKAMSTPATLVK
jgi:hypothetical protein